ncbi:GNAT family N-acetyltransferase [Peristeroidobacter agariperforans]|uniref:GNAT family N-acetyltransferase n=1 Tax=Peristeroidobacter agariperforans TaxID=268404 RepID=UPI00101D2563|nr:GNAT family N-acetyltransferase [Peristeroidobacter agariperforans]
MAASLQARIVTSINRVPATQWNALALGGNPFVRHEFLLAMEQAGCVGKAAGWLPNHLLLEEHGELVAAVPLYRKSHSWGEFVFDWSWARAYDQAGLSYYPKLVSMPPFTPATGPRLLLAPGASPAVRARLSTELLMYAKSEHFSSAHLLFLNDEDRASLSNEGYLWRKDCQFHWHNRGYKTFDDFIATFRSDKRKKALRERRRVREGGVTFRTLTGGEMDAKLWNIVFGFSAATFESHGHEHYLNVEFFQTVSAVMPQSVVIKLAEYQGHPIATAIFFRGDHVLYGRYWGAAANYHSLHFETCYYQGIEYCIEQGLQHFEPGTQGEHKVPRGFEPTTTWSAHWIADARFRRAIDHYLNDERAAIDQYILQVEEHTPYHRGP